MQERSIRRHHLERMKNRVKRMIKDCWSRPENLAEDRTFVGTLAANHGTHDCLMCHFEKHYPKPRERQIEEDCRG